MANKNKQAKTESALHCRACDLYEDIERNQARDGRERCDYCHADMRFVKLTIDEYNDLVARYM